MPFVCNKLSKSKGWVIISCQGGGGRNLEGDTKVLPAKREGGEIIMHVSGKCCKNSLR